MEKKHLYKILNQIKLSKTRQDVYIHLSNILSASEIYQPIPNLIQKYRNTEPNLAHVLSETLIKLRSM